MANLLLGATGSSGCLDLPGYLVALKREFDVDIRIILTPMAARMVSPELWGSMAGVRVYSDPFDRDDLIRVPHADLTTWADHFFIMPATANTISKVACGFADNLLTTAVISWARPVVFFPNMNVKMWNTPAIQRHVRTLVDLGHRVVAPTGNVRVTASGEEKAGGHMPSVPAVLEFVRGLLQVQEA